MVAYNPAIFLQIVHYILIDYSPAVYGYIVDKDYDLYAKTDLRFIQCVYKIMVKNFVMPNPSTYPVARIQY